MQIEMLAPLPDGPELKIVSFAISEPKPPSLFDRLAYAGGGVNALLNFMQRIYLPRLGGLPCWEGF